MKGNASVVLFALFPLLLTQGCNCGRPHPGETDGGTCAPADTCAVCPPGCKNADTCGADGGWACGCTCAATASNVCDDYASKACDFFIRCHSEQSLFFDASEGRGPALPRFGNDPVAASERARCQAALSQSRSCDEVLESFKAGRTTFDPVSYSACVAVLYPDGTCTRDLNSLQERCFKTSFATANSAVGGACQTDAECTHGWCNASGTDACGTCQSYLAPGGGACARDAQCDPAANYCSSSAGGCVPFHNDGESCSATELSSCGPNRQCILSGFLFSGTCRAGTAEGAACTLNRYQCQRSNRALPELLCESQSAGSSAGTCAKLQSPPGGHCGDGEQVIPTSSNNGIRGPLCPETQYCLSNACVPKKAAAAACGSDDECAAGLHCTGASGAQSCLPFQDLNQACGASTDCKNFLGCDSTSKCTPGYALEAEGCDGGVRCAQGYCQQATDGGMPACAAYKATGVGCADNGECRSNVCNATCQQACWQSR